MAFQRSYSKVWWGSDEPLMSDGTVGHHQYQYNYNYNNNNAEIGQKTFAYNNLHAGQVMNHLNKQQKSMPNHLLQETAYHTLNLNPYKCFAGNLSCIQEVEDENNSPKLTWPKHNSPRSLRSLDSGFSDNEEYLGGRTSKPISPSRHSLRSVKSDCDSPTSIRSINTPPTVIRQTGRSKFYAPLVNVSRRISFSTPRNKITQQTDITDEQVKANVNKYPKSSRPRSYEVKCLKKSMDNEVKLNKQMTNLPCSNFERVSPSSPSSSLSSSINLGHMLCDNFECKETNINQAAQINSNEQNKRFIDYKNDTVYMGDLTDNNTSTLSTLSTLSIPSYNNETVLLGATLMGDAQQNVIVYDPLGSLENQFKSKTSTPKTGRRFPLNLNDPNTQNAMNSVQIWLNGLRSCYEHEVMSTLQTKSILQEAFKNLTITTNTVAKLIRQLQQKALHMQASFETVERLIIAIEGRSLSEALTATIRLIEEVQEFSQILQRRGIFFANSRSDHKRYEMHLDQIRLVAKDTRYSVERHHYINMESLLEDIQVLKRNLLITIRQVYVKLLRILVQSIENNSRGGSDLMLRANINMIATLMNIDYDGFASLTDSFVQTEAVRTLLLVCLDNRLSSIRAMALRALATICSTPEPIAQLSSCGGIEILRDILQVYNPRDKDPSVIIKRSEMEKREAVSLLTQITAHWHGPNHRVSGLHSCIESLVEGLTDLLSSTECPQTLLLCAAALNNISRMEHTAHYSIMSHETIFKLIEATKINQNKDNANEKAVSVFLYEQIVAMLQNMSQNKKCHSHLANVNIINFITYAYQTEFYKMYSSRGENEAQKRTIKCILHTLARLTQDSVLGMELLEQQKHMPCAAMFFKNATTTANSNDNIKQQFLPLDNSHCHDIFSLARQLLQDQKQKRYQHGEQPQQQQQQQQQQNDEDEKNVANDEQQENQSSETIKDDDNLEKLKMQLARQESYV